MFLISECILVSVYPTTGRGWRGGRSKAPYQGLWEALRCLGLGCNDRLKPFTMPGRAGVRRIGPEPYATRSMMDGTLRSLRVLCGYWADGPSVMCILKKYEICFMKQLSALFAGFHHFMESFCLPFCPGLHSSVWVVWDMTTGTLLFVQMSLYVLFQGGTVYVTNHIVNHDPSSISLLHSPALDTRLATLEIWPTLIPFP